MKNNSLGGFFSRVFLGGSMIRINYLNNNFALIGQIAIFALQLGWYLSSVGRAKD
jgi:hypothetical protein